MKNASRIERLAVVVLAAGQGKRMKSDLPKVLQPLGGKPLLRYVLDAARALDPLRLCVVYGHGGDRVRSAIPDAGIAWALQAEQRGTGHALLQALPHIGAADQVLVLYGDVPLIRLETLRELIAKAGPRAISLLTVHLADPSGYGRVLRDPRGGVRRIVEEKDASPRQKKIREGNSGVMVLPAARLKVWLSKLRTNNAQGEYYLTDVIATAVEEKIRVVPIVAPTETEVLGVNDKVQLARLESELRRLRAHELMLAGATLIDPARVDVRGTVSVGRDVQIDVNVVFEGRVVLGDRVRIGPNCILRDSEIGADTNVHANSMLDRAVVGARCEVGPYARLRPESRMRDDAHVGNFVEMKKTTLGPGSKANHLTYLGDATIGARVNVGAGTITCNFDGASKWQTTIGDDAFIGSGSMLVAPVTIGAGATIGAGSTITRDAPDGQLTLERSKQLTVPGWTRPIRAAKK